MLAIEAMSVEEARMLTGLILTARPLPTGLRGLAARTGAVPV
ncbi:hypothetical protein [Streptomyces katsurahamanus]|nr:hypothetical protein [Streptomyces katsurahamanus]